MRMARPSRCASAAVPSGDKLEAAGQAPTRSHPAAPVETAGRNPAAAPAVAVACRRGAPRSCRRTEPEPASPEGAARPAGDLPGPVGRGSPSFAIRRGLAAHRMLRAPARRSAGRTCRRGPADPDRPRPRSAGERMPASDGIGARRHGRAGLRADLCRRQPGRGRGRRRCRAARPHLSASTARSTAWPSPPTGC